MKIALHLRRRSPLDSLARLEGPMAHAEFVKRHGADPADVALIRAFARAASLRLTQIDLISRTVVLSGSAARMRSAFGGLGAGGGAHQVPAALRPAVCAILGPGNEPAVRPHFKALAPFNTGMPPDVAHYTVTEVARWYRFPPHLDGSGQTIGLLQLGGGFRRADLAAYFQRLRLPMPRITTVSISGARNRPVGGVLSADTEVCLDIEVAGAAAPGAHLVVYFAPNTHRGFVDGVKAAVYDHRHRPSVVSISWGNAEPSWNRAALRTIADVLDDAAVLGVTVCASSGDQGPDDGLTRRAVEFPASSPGVLSCGGTRLVVRGGKVRQRPWNDASAGWGQSGGGVSARFGRPDYQRRVETIAGKRNRRAVPDVAGNADPETGYVIRVNGHWIRMAGTSAVAPLWAGLLARCMQGMGQRLGRVNDVLYARSTRALQAVYAPRPGRRHRRWHAFTGLGTPDGRRLLTLLQVRSKKRGTR